jgi:hypothetical protein
MDFREKQKSFRLEYMPDVQRAADIVEAVRNGSVDSLQRPLSGEYDAHYAVHTVTALQQPLGEGDMRRYPGYADWQWPHLLLRCIKLPDGVFEVVLDFLPMPRIWHWSLLRLKRRTRTASKQAVTDVSIMLDEMLKDLNIFPREASGMLLVTLSRDKALQRALVRELKMPQALVDSLVQWSDIQSLNQRSSDSDVSFRPVLAYNFMNVAVDLFKYVSHT